MEVYFLYVMVKPAMGSSRSVPGDLLTFLPATAQTGDSF